VGVPALTHPGRRHKLHETIRMFNVTTTLAVILSLALLGSLAACDRDGGASKAGTQNSDTASTMAAPGTADKPTGTPVQTGEVPAGTSAGDGTKTGTRTTPPPK
jgi:hypothetical protein